MHEEESKLFDKAIEIRDELEEEGYSKSDIRAILEIAIERT